MGNEKAEELIRKYLEGTATPEEEALLEAWYISMAQAQPEVTADLDYSKTGEEMLRSLRAEQGEMGLRGIGTGQREEGTQPTVKTPVRRIWPRVVAAASVLVVLAIGSIFVLRKKPGQAVVETPVLAANDILPAGVRATLTLIDGTPVALDSVGGRVLPRQGSSNVRIVNGQLIYDAGQVSGGLAYNTLTTRPGEHYALQLPDGTKVWLNAASSITYPVAFAGNERKVTVTGELYFEIVHNAQQPFRVAVKDQLVEDIGTHFNIHAYEDEPAVSTTLIEGSIKVARRNVSTLLIPGQQAVMGSKDSVFEVRTIDTAAAMAWKNGYFYFDRADIKTVMRELARWYNVEVAYQGDIPKKTFKGKVYRDIRASEALKILAYFGAHSTIEGKTITVSF